MEFARLLDEDIDTLKLKLAQADAMVADAKDRTKIVVDKAKMLIGAPFVSLLASSVVARMGPLVWGSAAVAGVIGVMLAWHASKVWFVGHTSSTNPQLLVSPASDYREYLCTSIVERAKLVADLEDRAMGKAAMLKEAQEVWVLFLAGVLLVLLTMAYEVQSAN